MRLLRGGVLMLYAQAAAAVSSMRERSAVLDRADGVPESFGYFGGRIAEIREKGGMSLMVTDLDFVPQLLP